MFLDDKKWPRINLCGFASLGAREFVTIPVKAGEIYEEAAEKTEPGNGLWSCSIDSGSLCHISI